MFSPVNFVIINMCSNLYVNILQANKRTLLMTQQIPHKKLVKKQKELNQVNQKRMKGKKIT